MIVRSNRTIIRDAKHRLTEQAPEDALRGSRATTADRYNAKKAQGERIQQDGQAELERRIRGLNFSIALAPLSTVGSEHKVKIKLEISPNTTSDETIATLGSSREDVEEARSAADQAIKLAKQAYDEAKQELPQISSSVASDQRELLKRKESIGALQSRYEIWDERSNSSNENERINGIHEFEDIRVQAETIKLELTGRPKSWNPSNEFNSLPADRLPPVGIDPSDAYFTRSYSGLWIPVGAGSNPRVLTFGSGSNAQHIAHVNDESRTALTTPRSHGTFPPKHRRYPAQPPAFTDRVTGVTGARSHLIPYADTPGIPGDPNLALKHPDNFVSHLSKRYNEQVRRKLEDEFRKSGHQWTAYNVMGDPPRYSTGKFDIPEAEIIIEHTPNGRRAWRFPNDLRYDSMNFNGGSIFSHIRSFEMQPSDIPSTPVK
jgi:hypothetical protein